MREGKTARAEGSAVFLLLQVLSSIVILNAREEALEFFFNSLFSRLGRHSRRQLPQTVNMQILRKLELSKISV